MHSMSRPVQYHDSDYLFDEIISTGQAFEAQLTHSTTTTTTTTTPPASAWETFHQRHSKGRFFKPKRYLVAEFPELIAMDQSESDIVVLDAGCGNGAAIIPFLRATTSLRSVAFDCSQQAVELLKSTVKDTTESERVNAQVCDIMNAPLPLLTHSVDAGLLIFVLSAVPIERMPVVLNEIHRVLKPGALLCFRDYGIYDMSHLRSTNEQWLGGRTFYRGDEQTLVTFFDLDMLQKLFESCHYIVDELKYACVENHNRKTKKSWKRCFVHAKLRTKEIVENQEKDTKEMSSSSSIISHTAAPSIAVPIALKTPSVTATPSITDTTTSATTTSTATISTTTTSTSITPNNNHLSIRPSQIGEIAGDGLYVTANISKGSIICIYTGEIYTTHDAMRLPDKSYLMRLGSTTPGIYIDAINEMNVLARYINDCRHQLLYNVTFDKKPEEKCANVVALRDIKMGEELFVDYGWKYWLGMKGKRLPPRIANQILMNLE